jgi:hypothetical protein
MTTMEKQGAMDGEAISLRPTLSEIEVFHGLGSRVLVRGMNDGRL